MVLRAVEATETVILYWFWDLRKSHIEGHGGSIFQQAEYIWVWVP